MSAMSVVWLMLFSFGCVAAIAALEGLPLQVHSLAAEQRVARRRLARGARGAAIMTFALAALLNHSLEMGAPLWLACVILSYVAIMARRPGQRRLHDWITRAAWLTVATGVVAFVESVLREGRTGLFLCGISAVLAAAARVDFLLDQATNDLLPC